MVLIRVQLIKKVYTSHPKMSKAHAREAVKTILKLIMTSLETLNSQNFFEVI